MLKRLNVPSVLPKMCPQDVHDACGCQDYYQMSYYRALLSHRIPDPPKEEPWLSVRSL
jgi:hypothetical protein